MSQTPSRRPFFDNPKCDWVREDLLHAAAKHQSHYRGSCYGPLMNVLNSIFQTELQLSIRPHFGRREPELFIPDFLGAKYQPDGFYAPFGFWEVKKYWVDAQDGDIQMRTYLESLANGGASPAFRVYVVDGPTTVIYNIRGDKIGEIGTGSPEFYQSLESLFDTAVAM